MKRTTRQFFVAAHAILLFLLLSICLRASDVRKDTVSILFLGSSSTYCHDMPLQVSDLLNSGAAWISQAFLTGKSGTGFHEYLRPGFTAQYGLSTGQTLREKILTEKYDYVVIQQITYFMGDQDSLEIRAATREVCEMVREAGGIPVFYEMGWRKGAENEIGRKIILEEARKNRIAYYAPCSRAWKKVRAEQPDIELHNLPDTDHPGTLGNYLNMCCFYAAFTGTSPVGLPAEVNYWPPFGKFDKDVARQKLDITKLDYYHETMPEWMQLISIMASEKSIDPEIAEYLQKTAWEVWQEVSENLKSNTQ